MVTIGFSALKARNDLLKGLDFYVQCNAVPTWLRRSNIRLFTDFIERTPV